MICLWHWEIDAGSMSDQRINSGKQRWKNVGEANYSPVTIKTHGTMWWGLLNEPIMVHKPMMGFID